ncbi:MAG TPA: hypothetical protein VIK74_07175 [Parasegetibacter sp.]
MKMRNLLFTVLFFLAAFSVNAQPPGGGQNRTPEERAKMTIERMTPELKLNKEQQEKMTAIYADYYKEMSKMREGLPQGERPSPEKMEKITAGRDEKVKTVLSEDQFKKLKEMEAAMRGGGGGRRPGGGGRQ